MYSTMVQWLGRVSLAIAVCAAVTQAPGADKGTSPVPATGSVIAPEKDAQSSAVTTIKARTAAEKSTDSASQSPKRAPAKPPADKADSAAGKPQRADSSTLEVVPEDRAGDEQPEKPTESADAEPLKPIPDSLESDPVPIEAASFNGVTPATSTVEDVRKAWGTPKEMIKRDGLIVHLYTVDPFEQVEVSFLKEKATSIVIRLQQSFPAAKVAEQLKLADVRPVMISNDMGKILGQSFPERGVLFAFEPAEEPGKATMQVSQIILEPISAEPFVLRAETNLNTKYTLSLRDLDEALKIDSTNARAHWLRSRLLTVLGKPAEALEAGAKAVQLDPSRPRYRITRAQILSQMGKYAEAVEAAAAAAASSQNRPHVKARAICMLGDLASSGPERDYKRAIKHHLEAIKLAEPLAGDPHPAIRLCAKEVLVDAHLGAANDIAWGHWKQKEAAVDKWLEEAATFAEDLVENDGAAAEHQFRVATGALAAYVGAQGKLDPTEWTKQTTRLGPQLIDAATDPAQKRQLAWEVGMALYDALQVYQMRGDNQAALEYGQTAIEYLEQGGRQKEDTPAVNYLLGRLYFRLGAIHAVAEGDHKAAITWFDKAVPLLEKPVPKEALPDLGRHGETFVSMGVSYWEAGQRQRAVKLTEQGITLIEKAVADGTLDESSLTIPYNNMATMHRQLGQDTKAEKFAEMAAKHKDSQKR